jgi:hypothetical protein
MAVNSSRKQISLPKDFIKKLSKFTRDAGFASDSETIRHCVSECMKDHYGDSSKREDAEDKISIHDDNVRRQFELVLQRLELIDIRLNKQSATSEIGNVFRNIVTLLLNAEEDIPAILRKCKAYDQKLVNQVLSIMMDLGIIGYTTKNRKGETK